MNSLATSLRSRPLEDTLARARALAPLLAITDLGDATPHDVLGVPVWFCHRPTGQTRTLTAGKGAHRLQAQVGALMEAIEVAVAERADAASPAGTAPLAELLAGLRSPLTMADLAPRLGTRVAGSTEVPFDEARDLPTGRTVRLPSELLRLVPPPTGPEGILFGAGSNGLASGNTVAEATLHALLEVLERDTVALTLADQSARRIEPTTWPDTLATWRREWLDRGVRLELQSLPNPFGLACVQADLISSRPGEPAQASGFGCHPSAAIAAMRAVTEAAQSRLFALCHGQAPSGGGRVHARPAPAAAAPCGFDELLDAEAAPIESLLDALLQRLQAEGFPMVLQRQLDAGLALGGLHVVKVVVPGCETLTGAHARVGRRLGQRILAQSRPGRLGPSPR